MSYYWFIQEILQKAKQTFSKEKAAKYYAQNKIAIKKSHDSVIKTCHKKKKDKIKEYQRKKYQELVQYKREALKNK